MNNRNRSKARADAQRTAEFDAQTGGNPETAKACMANRDSGVAPQIESHAEATNSSDAREISLKGFLSAHAGIFFLTLIGAAIRFYELGRRGMWVDEVVTWNIARSGNFTLFGDHGIYFALVQSAMRHFGDSEAGIRLVSALLGVACIPMTYLCGLSLWGRREGLIAAAGVTGSSWLIFFSQEARFYTGFFFASAWVLYALIGLTRTGQFRYLLLFIAGLPILRGMHPTAMVFAGVAGGWLALWFIAWPRGWRTIWSWISWGQRRWNPLTIATAVAAGALLVIALFFAYKANAKYRNIFASLSFSNRTENVAFTKAFFLNHYRVFSPTQAYFTGWLRSIVILQTLFFFVGWYRAVRYRLHFALMTVSLLTLTFLLLFSYATFQPYKLKYSMFLSPPILLIFAGGAGLLVDRVIPLISRQRPEAWKEVVIVSLALLITFAATGEFRAARSMEVGAFKPAFALAEKNFSPGDQIVSHDFGRGPVHYYVMKSKIPLQSYTMLETEGGDGNAEIGRVEALAQSNKNVWLIASKNWRMNPKLKDYALEHFDEVQNFQSMWGRRFDVQLMKWKWAGTTISGNGAVDISPGLILSDASRIAPLASDSITSIPLFVARSGAYTLKTQSGTPVQIEGLSEVDGKIVLHQGTQNLVLRPAAPGTISLVPDYSSPLIIEAERASRFPVPGRLKIQETHERVAIVYEINAGAEYDIEMPESGRLKLDLIALAKKPGGTIFDVTIDGEPKGFVLFTKTDDTWDQQSMVLRGKPGSKRLGISFLTDSPYGTAAEINVDGILDKIQLTAISEDEASTLDHAQPLDPAKMVSDPGSSLNLSFPPPGTILDGKTGWRFEPGVFAKVEIPDFSKPIPTLRVDLPYKGPVQLISPLFSVQPGKSVYYELEIATEAVLNHTANAAIVFWTKEGRGVASASLYTSNTGLHNAGHWQEGTNHQTMRHFERFAALEPVPQGVTAASIVLVAYDNSTQQVPEDGCVWYRNIRVHSPRDFGRN